MTLHGLNGFAEGSLMQLPESPLLFCNLARQLERAGNRFGGASKRSDSLHNINKSTPMCESVC